MIVATNNKNKLREIKKNLNYDGLKSLSDIGLNIDIEEDQDTFYGNAFKKAVEIYKLTNEEVISDNSGLCIDLFNGWPGVYTHRFLGENKTEKEREYWSNKVMTQLIEKGIDLKKDKIIFLAGKNYRENLIKYINNYVIPLEGLSIGNQLKYLKSSLNIHYRIPKSKIKDYEFS